MKELQEILQVIQHLQRMAALATVVSISGSGYRQPGARMLITQDGQTQGTISGGCLENDVVEHAKQVMLSAQPRVVSYNTTIEEDILWGFGLGCNGIVQILIEPLDPHRQYFPLNIYKNCLSDHQSRAIATVTDVQGLVKVKLGDRLVLQSQRVEANEIEELDLIHLMTSDARMTLLTECSTTHHYQLPSGTVDVFIEFLQPPLPLIVFGAGEGAKPLVQFAKALGWQVTVVDCRANEASYTRFSMSDRVILTRREKLSQQVNIDRHTVAIVMTHNYLDDLAILQWLLPSSICYLGLMGAKKRTDRLLQELSLGDGVQRQKLYAPVGLDIGANTPEEIALAIIAEIQAVLKKRSGGFLKDRQGAIHGNSEVLCPSV